MADANHPVTEQYSNLTTEDRREIALEYLRGLTPGFQEIETFRQLARLGGLDTVEVLPIRTSPEDGESAEVLLARRSENDHFWPGLLHVAGSIILEDDPIEHEHDYRPAISRAMEEMGGVRFTHEPFEMETVHRRGPRSREVTVRFWGEVEGETTLGEFYDVTGVLRHAPELGIFDSHAAFIKRVADAYDELRIHRND